MSIVTSPGSVTQSVISNLMMTHFNVIYPKFQLTISFSIVTVTNAHTDVRWSVPIGYVLHLYINLIMALDYAYKIFYLSEPDGATINKEIQNLTNSIDCLPVLVQVNRTQAYI